MIALYTKFVFKSSQLSKLQAIALAVIYVFMFITLQLEEYALLMGSIGLFVVLAIAMMSVSLRKLGVL